MSRRLLACGEHALLVELDGLDEVLALDAVVRAARKSGDPAFTDVVDVVPAARTLMVIVHEGASLTPLRRALPALDASDHSDQTGQTGQTGQTIEAAVGAATGATADDTDGPDHPQRQTVELREILVSYDGPDLAEVCELTGLTEAEVIAAHTGTPWRVAFAGFSPGFAYLCGGDPRLQVPRRQEPRTSVRAGSVGLAGEFSAIYPRSSPGGWQLLGHTDAILWDVDRTPPALLEPGSQVRFVDAATELGSNPATKTRSSTSPSTSSSTSPSTSPSTTSASTTSAAEAEPVSR